MIKKYLLSFIFLFSISVFSQNPAIVENTFNTNNISNVSGGVISGFDKGFSLPDGKILVYMNCTGCRFNGVPIRNVERLNADGTLDTTFNVGGTGASSFSDVHVFPDSKMLLAGNFFDYNGVSVTGIVKINQNGSIDNSFNLSLNNGVSKILAQTDGKIIIGGNFTTNGTSNYNRILRLNADGTVDTSFTIGSGFNGAVNTMFLQPDGKIIVGGSFTTYDGVAANRIIRLNSNGTIDPSFNIGSGFNNTILSICLSQDNKIYIGGAFTTYNGLTNNRLVRLNDDGSIDTSFSLGTGFNSSVSKIILLPDSSIAALGTFTSYNGIYRSGSVKLNNSGTVVSTSLFSKSYGIKDISLQSDNKMIVSGRFSSIGNVVVNSIVKLNSDESIDVTSFTIGVGFNNIVYKVKQQSDGKILVGGDFTLYNNNPLNFLARLNEDGSVDTSFNSGGTGFNSPVTKFEIQPDGKIIVVGYFTTYNGLSANRIIRLNNDGSIDNTFVTGTGFDNWVEDLVLQTDGKIVVSGSFRNYNGNGADLLARLNSNGSFDTDYYLSDLTNAPKVLALQYDGKLLVGTLNSTTGNTTIKRFNTNGTADSFFYSLTDGNSGGIYTLTPQSDGKIIVGGSYFTKTNNLIRLNSNGIKDNSFITGVGFNGAVRAIHIQPDNKILIGGSFNTYNGSTSWHAIRLNLNGSIDNSFNTGLGFTGSIYDFNLQSDGKILVGGAMVNYGTYTVGSLTRLIGGGFYNLSGQNKLDTNLNGCDVADYPFPNLKMNFNDGFSNYDFFVNNTGDYSFLLGQGNYTITPIVNSNFSISPTSISASFPSQYTSLVQNYCITPLNGSYADLEVQLIPLNPARPGFDSNYKLIYKNKGAVAQSGTVNLTFDDQVMDLVSSVPVVNAQLSNSLSWNFSNLNPQETRTIDFVFNLNSPMETPALNSGDVLSYNVSFSGVLTDYTPFDNTFSLNQNVVNSYDPNDKTCLQGNTVGSEKIGDYVHYLIRFENNGTANAEFIRIEDFIDTSKFDISSLEPLYGSHNFITKISNTNKVEFFFNNINLPFDDANNDGYVAYKIKLKSSLIVGDTFTNTANIYFDFNPAIITNTAQTIIVALSNEDFQENKQLVVYPNPVVDYLYLKLNPNFQATNFEIFNLMGQSVFSSNEVKNNVLDLRNLESGFYVLKFSVENNSQTIKFIKK